MQPHTMKPYPKPVKVETDRTLIKCKVCGTQFQAFRSYRNICSYKCGQVFDGKAKPVKAIPIKKRAPKSSPHVRVAKKIMQEMIDEVGYVYCQHCGKSTPQVFNTHHIIFQSEKPKHKFLHKKENLLITHPQCHDLYHTQHKGIRNALVIERGLDKIFGADVLNK